MHAVSYSQITLKDGIATISDSITESPGFKALEDLRDASSVIFGVGVVKDTQVIASELQIRAINQIGSLRKIIEGIGSVLFSCFGFKTTTQKVNEVYEIVFNKKFAVIADPKSPASKTPVVNSSPKPKENSPEIEPSKPLPNHLQKAKADLHAYISNEPNYNEIKHVIDETYNRIEDLQEAEKYVESLKTDEEKEVAYAVLASIDHYEHALKYAKLIAKNAKGPYVVTTIDENGKKIEEEVPDFSALKAYEGKKALVGLKNRANIPLLYHVLDKFGLRSDEEVAEYLNRRQWAILKSYASNGFYLQAITWLNNIGAPYKNASLLLKFTIDLFNQHLKNKEFDKAKAVLETIRFTDIKDKLNLELLNKQNT